MTKQVQIKDGRDVTRLLQHYECPIRMGKGSHRVANLPNNQTLVYYEHGEFHCGMLHHILKILKTAGIILLFTSPLLRLIAGGIALAQYP